MKTNWPTKKLGEYANMCKPSLKVILKGLWDFSVPILYLFFWITMLKLAKEWLGSDILDNNLFLVITLVIIFMGIISKSTSWSIGGDKGIKGDSLGKYVEFHSGGNPPWDYKLFIEDEQEAKAKIESSEKIVEKINIKVVKKT